MSHSQQQKIIHHIRHAGHITVFQAIQDHQIAALPRRISDLEERGFKFDRVQKTHPVTGQRYVHYKFADGSPRSFEEARRNPWKPKIELSPAL